ncbi:hypothetical protein GGI35DRAFT_492027 [Trichoderma velutinum]
MPRKSLSTFFKDLRSKSRDRRDQAGSSSNVPDHGDAERGQSLQLDTHSICPPSGRSASMTLQPSTSGDRVLAMGNLPVDPLTYTADAAQNDPNDRKRNATSPQELWDDAYDGLKTEQPKLMQMYEVIVSRKLQDSDIDGSREENKSDVIATAGDERRAQMLAIIQSGQLKIKKEVKVKESIGEMMEIVNSAKSIISTAIQAAPQAALPWSIVSMALEIVQNPLKEQKDNNEGIQYTIKRMEWYWSLSSNLFHGVESLRSHDIILFQIKSVCSFYRNRGLQLFRDVIMIDDWKQRLNEIRTLEAEFQNDYTIHMSQEGKSISYQIKNCLEKLVALQVNNLEQQDRDCLRDLRITNPRDGRKRLLDTKGGLLPGSYSWAVESAMFQKWYTEKQTNLLWIKGSPGKGKTMMVCGFIEELEHMEPHQNLLSYFFCQGTDPSFNNATAVLRGMIYLLAVQKPSLIEHVQQEYRTVGSRSLFDGINGWITPSGIFALENACLIVDALDECESDRKKLLDLITESTLAAPQVKWILSSRNFPDIEAKLRSCQTSVVIDLESNAILVSESVDAYIRCRTRQLNLVEDNEVLQEHLQSAILQKSSGTFLWAALVFKELEELRTYDDNAEVLQLLDDIPSGLIGLYERMMNQVDLLARSDRDRCRNILAIMAAAYQPLSLETLPILAGQKDRLTRAEHLKTVVRMCGSFLIIKEDVVYFVHQSAKDYLAMLKPGKLRPNIYSLPYPGVKIHEISIPQPDPLASITYCCIHWLQHFCDGIFDVHSGSKNDMDEGVDKIFDFFRLHLLHWIEALSLSRNVQAGVVSLQNLLHLLTQNSGNTGAIDFFHDALRFILYNTFILETAPLQTYVSAIVFAPQMSHVRLYFKDKISWIKTLPDVQNHWSSCQYTLYCGTIISAVFSNDTSQLITLFPDGKVKKWEGATGKLIPSIGLDFEMAPSDSRALTFSDDSKLLAISDFAKITIWDLESGKRIHEFKSQSDEFPCQVISGDSMFLAVTHCDFVETWDLVTGKLVLKSLDRKYNSPVILSRDFKLLAGTIGDNILISNLATGEKVCEIPEECHPLLFSNDSSYLVLFGYSKDRGMFFKVWHIPSSEEIITCGRSGWFGFGSTTFSEDTKFLAVGDASGEIDVWNLEEKVKVKSYKGHTSAIVSVAFSRDTKLLVSVSKDGTVKVWKTDFTGSIDQQAQIDLKKFYQKSIEAVALSVGGDSTVILSGEEIKFWNTHKLPRTITIRISYDLDDVSFIRNGSFHLTVSRVSSLVAMMRIWSISSDRIFPEARSNIQVPLSLNIIAAAFSPNAKFLAAAYYNGMVCTIIIWRIKSHKIIDGDTISATMVHQDVVSAAVPAATRLFVDDALKESTENLPEHDDRYLIPTGNVNIGYSMKPSKDWILWNGKDMIWLPGDFRPSSTGAFSARSAEVALGTALGSLITMKFEEPSFEEGDWTPWKSSGFL